jgi:hypothetical protein
MAAAATIGPSAAAVVGVQPYSIEQHDVACPP